MKIFYLFGLLALFAACSFASGLTENPIVGDTILYLDGAWTASNGQRSINAKVPGDLITDLQNAGLIGDPLYNTNWLDSTLWSDYDWTYSTKFALEPKVNDNAVLLVFDGVKMGASVSLNGRYLGNIVDQFLRYNFSIKSYLRSGLNDLTVTFPKGAGIDVMGRFMACSGGWDWAPYSNTRDQHGATTFSKGIWKSVYLVSISSVAITHVAPLTYYSGAYPTTPLSDNNHAPFLVKTNVFLYSEAQSTGTLVVRGSWGNTVSKVITVTPGDSVVQVQLSAPSVSLWWPVGLGRQNLYDVTVEFTPDKSTSSISTSRSIGFRTIALVTANDTDPSTLVGKQGSGDLTLRIKVNGANLWARGGNMIPMEELEGRANADAFKFLIQSAVEGNMNMLRIWGGGIFQYDIFYDTCDQLGILIYHDMMYAQGGHNPAVTPTQDAELRHQVRRLSNHPSIIIWDGCNECGGQGIYSSFVVTTVREEDTSRIVWPSCPSAGWTTGVDMLWGLPDAQTPLIPKPNGSPFETHGPYQHGSGWPAVNGDSRLELFNPNNPPQLHIAPTGPAQRGTFASEFGCVAMSSFESMSVTLPASDWSLHSKPMYQRNYPCDNIIEVYFGTQNLNEVGELPFKRQLYQCLIGQALEMKSDIENRRSYNSWGTVIWQINEIWPTGGWGSVEYGTPVPGQVIGGRWKPLHYVLKASAFSDVMSTCGTDARCYIKNDGIYAFSGTLNIDLIRFSTGTSVQVYNSQFNLPAGAGVSRDFCLENGANGACNPWDTLLSKYQCSITTCALRITASASGVAVSENTLILSPPKNLVLPEANVKFTIQENIKLAEITLTTDAVALFVTLTTTANGRFSDNAFLLTPGSRTIQFYPFGNLDVRALTSTLRVEHAKMYL